ncbi:prepilin-type N-terminal cleavage/methylation domain-containing protein [bacterium]|nr:prepilin-type N-terminal cleavage/methylation domain-containing protein [bacterium]
MRNARNSGFTLFELIVVISIIGIVMAVTMPKFLRSLTAGRLRSESIQLLTAIRYAQGMAAVQRATYLLHVDLDNQSYYLTREASRSDDFELTDQDMLSSGQSSLFPGQTAQTLPRSQYSFSSTPVYQPEEEEGLTNRNAAGRVDIFDEEAHEMPPGIRIAMVVDVRGEEISDGTFSIPFDPQGGSIETEIVLSTDRDEDNAVAVVHISATGLTEVIIEAPQE